MRYRTLSSGKRVRFTMRMNGCQKHAQVRETVLRKGLPNGGLRLTLKLPLV